MQLSFYVKNDTRQNPKARYCTVRLFFTMLSRSSASTMHRFSKDLVRNGVRPRHRIDLLLEVQAC